MSLDISLIDNEDEVLYDTNITHNLTEMAKHAGLYEVLWRPELINAKYAKDIIELVEEGLKVLKSEPDFFKQFNSKNGWGLYEHFVTFVSKYLEALKKYPEATLIISR